MIGQDPFVATQFAPAGLGTLHAAFDSPTLPPKAPLAYLCSHWALVLVADTCRASILLCLAGSARRPLSSRGGCTRQAGRNMPSSSNSLCLRAVASSSALCLTGRRRHPSAVRRLSPSTHHGQFDGDGRRAVPLHKHERPLLFLSHGSPCAWTNSSFVDITNPPASRDSSRPADKLCANLGVMSHLAPVVDCTCTSRRPLRAARSFLCSPESALPLPNTDALIL